MTWIQTTAPISEGDSGGPLVNEIGKVVGVNSWTYRTGQNLNFSISCKDLQLMLSGVQDKPLISLGSQRLSTSATIPTGALGSQNSRAQAVYDLYAKEHFERQLKAAERELKNASASLQQELWSEQVSDDALKKARDRYELALRKIKGLADFDPGVSELLGAANSVIGEPGEWYVMQVLGPDSFLASRERFSELTFCVKDVSTAGIVDGLTTEFDGIWYVSGETYMYKTVGGSSRTVYVLRGLNSDISSLLSVFRKEQAKPTLDAAVTSVPQPKAPSGTALVDLNKRRMVYRSEQATAEKLRAEKTRMEQLAQLEKRAANKVQRAKQRLKASPNFAKRLLKETIDEFPGTKAAEEASELLGEDAHIRTWRSGRYATDAMLLDVSDGIAVLRKPDGTITRVPVKKLSPEDQEYINRKQSLHVD